MPMREKPLKRGAPWMRFAGLGVDFAATVGVFILIGYWIDRHWQLGRKATITGAILGLIGGMYNLIRRSLAAFEETSRGDNTADHEES